MTRIETIGFKEGLLYLIDQTKLPMKEELIITDEYERVAVAIERLEVRGAPAIGVAAAYGLALSLKNIAQSESEERFDRACRRIAGTRPTAVNLFNAIDKMKKIFDENRGCEEIYDRLIEKAVSIHEEDIKLCDAIALNGLSVFRKKSRVLTHCNAGALATGGGGTALNVIRNGFEKGLVEHVYSDETRPLFQGSRLTAWELERYGIPFTINTDSTAAYLMQMNKIDLVIVGADRIAVNGDVANKIGTYSLAVLCKYHGIPFYVAAPFTSIDLKCLEGSCIKIEERNKTELTRFGEEQITCKHYNAYCPAFDITPNGLITAIITEREVFEPPYSFSHV
jgi:methylthioribose-1-phosphate isomerase